MMALFGWMVCMVTMLWVTAASALVSFNMLGKYNIGGVPNTLKDKVIAIIFDVAVALAWYGVYLSAPFTLTAK